MNEKRRRKIKDVITELGCCSSKIEDIKQEEDESRENLPENLQNSERYASSEDDSDNMDDAISNIQEAIYSLKNIN